MRVASCLGRSTIEGLETYRHAAGADPMITHSRGIEFRPALLAAAQQKTTRTAACR
jgi:hypothetical protein